MPTISRMALELSHYQTKGKLIRSDEINSTSRLPSGSSKVNDSCVLSYLTICCSHLTHYLTMLFIFTENNRHVTSDTIDLHGLYVQESLSYAENFINQAEKNNGSENLRIIVGKGLHSQNFQAKLKPAIEKLVKKHHLAIDFDNHNAGVLLVRRNVPNDRVGLDRNLLNHLSSDTNHSGKDDGCIIV